MNENPDFPGRHPTGPRVGGPAPEGPATDEVRTFDLLLVVVLTAGLFLAVGTLIDTPRMTVGFIVSMLAVQSAIPMAVIYLVVIRRRGLPWSVIGFRPAPEGWYLRAILIALLALPAVALVNLATQAIVGAPFRNPQVDMLAPEGFTWAGLLGMLIMVGIAAPIVEEVVFRGLLYGWLRRKAGMAFATGLSALAFALVHGIAILVPALFLIGIVLARVYERSGSLWPPIIVHATFNMVMTLALYAALAADVSLE